LNENSKGQELEKQVADLPAELQKVTAELDTRNRVSDFGLSKSSVYPDIRLKACRSGLPYSFHRAQVNDAVRVARTSRKAHRPVA
jgi:hypothetical protein